MGVAEAKDNAQLLAYARAEMTLITGQLPRVMVAHKSNAGFNLRQGAPIGLKVNLRGPQMWAFLERLIYIVLPRIERFSGLPQNYGFDGHGNYNLGLRQISLFPELREATQRGRVGAITRGCVVTIHTTAKNNDECRRLLTAIGMPILGGPTHWTPAPLAK